MLWNTKPPEPKPYYDSAYLPTPWVHAFTLLLGMGNEGLFGPKSNKEIINYWSKHELLLMTNLYGLVIKISLDLMLWNGCWKELHIAEVVLSDLTSHTYQGNTIGSNVRKVKGRRPHVVFRIVHCAPGGWGCDDDHSHLPYFHESAL